MKKTATFHFYDENGEHVDSQTYTYRDSVCEAYSKAEGLMERFGYDWYELVEKEG